MKITFRKKDSDTVLVLRNRFSIGRILRKGVGEKWFYYHRDKETSDVCAASILAVRGILLKTRICRYPFIKEIEVIEQEYQTAKTEEFKEAEPKFKECPFCGNGVNFRMIGNGGVDLADLYCPNCDFNVTISSEVWNSRAFTSPTA